MQISTMVFTGAPRLGILEAQVALAKAQTELSSGRLADIGLGLGSTTGTYVALDAQRARLQTFKDGNGLASTTLAAASSALDTLRSTASTFLSSLTAAATAGNVPGVLVSTAAGNLDALTSTLDTTVDGNAIFAGINTSVPPMTAYTAGSPAKLAVDGAFAAAFGMSQSSSSVSSIDGSAMRSFLDGSYASLFNPSGYASAWSTASDTPTRAQIAPGESVDTSVSANAEPFRQLAQAYAMVKEFGSAKFGSAAGQAVVAAATQLVAGAVAGLTSLGTGIGAAQTAISTADTRLTSQLGYLTSSTDALVGVDPGALSTTITALRTQIQASYSLTAQLQQLSLANYIK